MTTRYVSEFTLFLEELKQKNPHLEHEQRAGRAIHWDKPYTTPEEQRRIKLATVPKKPYEYY